mgnify:CR=1 FL=1
MMAARLFVAGGSHYFEYISHSRVPGIESMFLRAYYVLVLCALLVGHAALHENSPVRDGHTIL